MLEIDWMYRQPIPDSVLRFIETMQSWGIQLLRHWVEMHLHVQAAGLWKPLKTGTEFYKLLNICI